MKITEGLNIRQKEAVEHITGPCLVLAGAGSGKTKVLTTRIANLIEHGIYSSHILAITFTNKAAKEMKDRLSKLIGDNSAFVGTFHSFGLRIIKENFKEFGLKSNFSIVDSEDVNTIIRKIMKELNINSKEVSIGYVKNRISFIKNEMLSMLDVNRLFISPIDKLVSEIYYRYDATLKNNNTVDFDDLLKLPVELFKNDDEILDKYQERYQYILVDEYQDTNEVQYQLIKLLSSKYRNIFVVGDHNQAIYGFRWSNYKNILNFEKDYPDALTVTLNQNYRSTTTILDAANNVIKNNNERKDLELFSDLGKGLKIKYFRAYDEKQEVTLIIEEIKKLLQEGNNYNDIAILYRTNGQARIIEEGINNARFPYRIVGSYYFYKRKEIKDLIAYLKLISNHDDEVSLRRIINEPKRGIGTKSLDDLSKIATTEGISLFNALNKPKEVEFKNLILELTKDSENASLTELIDLILEKSGMKKELEDNASLENEIRLENLMEFRSITENYQNEVGGVNLEDFLDEISIVSDISEHKDVSNAITLMTMHSAKGLEFKNVFLAGMEENIMPHSMSLQEENGLEEERRLCYVAITRAKERLYLSNAKRRMLFGNTQNNSPSRFITEIDDSLIDKVNMDNEPKKFEKQEYYEEDGKTYHKGDIVIHMSYGRGVVIDFDEKFVTIAFNKRFGVKKILSNYKGLKKE